MTDSEISALAAAFKGVIEEQALALRAQIAGLRADLDVEREKAAQHRLFEAEARQRMLKSLGDAIGDAVAPRLRQIEQRTAELEQRGVGTAAPGVAQ